MVDGCHRVAVQHHHGLHALEGCHQFLAREGTEGPHLHQGHPLALLLHKLGRVAGGGSQRPHGHDCHLGILDALSLDETAVTTTIEPQVVGVGTLDGLLGGHVQGLVELVPPLHVLTLDVDVAVAAHTWAGVVLGEVQVLHEVDVGRKLEARQKGVDSLLRR